MKRVKPATVASRTDARINQLIADLHASGMGTRLIAEKVHEVIGVKLNQSSIVRRLNKGKEGSKPPKPKKAKALTGQVVSGDVGPREIPRVELDWRDMNPKEGVAKGFMVQVEAAEWFKLCARTAATEELKAHYYGLAAHAGRGVVQSYEAVANIDGDAAMSEMREQLGSVLGELARGLEQPGRAN